VGHRAGVISSADRKEETSWPNSAHEARRFILGRLPGSAAVDGASADAERYGRADEPAVLVEPSLIEGKSFRAIPVLSASEPRPQSGFSAFLDGTQQISIVNQCEGVPIVWATISAAIRARVDRRLIAWPAVQPSVRRRFYVPFRYLEGLDHDLAGDSRFIDTASPLRAEAIPSRHPAALMEAALQRIQGDRERLELDLAEAWCERGDGILYVDGSITGSAIASADEKVVGVIKTHRRLYAEGDAFRVLVGLKAGERSSMFRVSPRSRSSVASWYVRVREPAGHDSLFGLLRIETSEGAAASSRADEISRWIIAEGAPLSLPDGRWDKMAYGIRDTEEFLRAIS
jgi:hypothetical protein